jgi:hypothetical protein
MFSFQVTINVKEITNDKAVAKAKAVEKLANDLDLEALQILASKSGKSGMSNKIKKFKNML